MVEVLFGGIKGRAWVVSACCGVSINSRVGANIPQMSSGRVFWCGIMVPGSYKWLSPQSVGYMIVWLEVSRGGIQVVSSRLVAVQMGCMLLL